MSRHLVEWLLRNPIDLPPIENVGTDRAWRVLMGLADHAHETTGLMWASDRTQEKETGLERRGVIQPVRQGLEAAGWLVDTGKRGAKGVKVFELVIPGYVRPVSSGEGDLATKTPRKTPSGVVSGVGSGVGSGEGDLAQTEQNRNTPLTPLTGQAPRTDSAPGGGSFISDCLERCVTWEQENYRGQAGVPLLKMWRREYAQIVTGEALAQNGLADLDSVVSWATSKRHGKDTAPRTVAPTVSETYQGDPDCPHCHGQGYGLMRDTQGVATTKKCVCRGGTWRTEETPPQHLRVV